MRKNIAIASGKGGTGKTIVSVNLSVLLASRKDTGFDHVSLFDLDVEEPNSKIFFKDPKLVLEEDEYRKVPVWDQQKCTLCGKCSKVCEFNAIAFLGTRVLVFPDLCHSCYACSTLCPADALPMESHKMGVSAIYKLKVPGLTFTENRMEVGQPSAVPLIAAALSKQKNIPGDNTLFLFDSPPGTSCPMIEVSKNVDFVLLVTEPTPFGLHDMSLAVETLRKLNKPMGVVVNKSGSGRDELIDDYCQKEGLEILGKIPQSREIAEAYSRGELVYNMTGEIADAWNSLADNFLSKIR